MKREYPMFIIDHSKSERYPFDYVVCLDRQYGFIARVVFMPTDSAFNDFISRISEIEGNNYTAISSKLKTGGVALVVDDFLYDFEPGEQEAIHIRSLLKRAIKKYVNSEILRTPGKGLGIENQIRQQKLTIERARSRFEDLVQRANGDTEYARYQIDLAEATLQSLHQLRNYQKMFSN